MAALVTVTLTAEQAEALALMAEDGVEEKRYDIDENHPYDDEEEAAALARCDVALAAVEILRAATPAPEVAQ